MSDLCASVNPQDLLRVENMSVAFRGQANAWLAVTEEVNFSIAPSEVFALVGESGCGKSVTAMGLLGLLPRPGSKILQGHAWFEGVDLLALSASELVKWRGAKISMIFQEPALALNPVRTMQSQLREALRQLPKAEADVRIEALMKRAGFADVARVLRSYPHELSGGMMQRVMIVMALLTKPRLLIADEPTTALDVTVQAQVMSLLQELCRETSTGLLLITHNLGLVAHYADRVGVMYAGRMVESAPVQRLLENPRHPYSQGLLRAVPEGLDSVEKLAPIPGSVPRPQEFDQGCRFRNRCPIAKEICARKPTLRSIGEHHTVACEFAT